MGVAVGILLLSHREVEICLGGKLPPHGPFVWVKHVGPREDVQVSSSLKHRRSFLAYITVCRVQAIIPAAIPSRVGVLTHHITALHIYIYIYNASRGSSQIESTSATAPLYLVRPHVSTPAHPAYWPIQKSTNDIVVRSATDDRLIWRVSRMNERNERQYVWCLLADILICRNSSSTTCVDDLGTEEFRHF